MSANLMTCAALRSMATVARSGPRCTAASRGFTSRLLGRSLIARSFAGHSKWANIKHKKAATDAARSKIFTKLTTKIRSALATAGGDVDAVSVVTAVAAARGASVPNSNIDRALSLSKDAIVLEGITYEANLGEVALVIEGLTANKNTTAGRVRHVLDKSGGSLGSTSWAFDRRGVVEFGVQEHVGDESEAATEWMLDAAIDAGALDVEIDDEFASVEITTEATDLNAVLVELRGAVAEAAGDATPQFELRRAELAYVPKMYVALAEGSPQEESLENLLSAFDDEDWVMKVTFNAERGTALEL